MPDRYICNTALDKKKRPLSDYFPFYFQNFCQIPNKSHVFICYDLQKTENKVTKRFSDLEHLKENKFIFILNKQHNTNIFMYFSNSSKMNI